MRVALIAALVLFSSVASAQEQHRFSTFVGAEAWSDRTAPGHGVVMAAWDVSGLADGARMSAEFNTDTLRLEYDGFPVTESARIGGRLTGELFISNLLTDYHLQGRNVPERTFLASYGEAEIWLKYSALGRLYIQPQVGVRRWWMLRRDETSPQLILPPDAWVLKPRLDVTWWQLRDDAGWRDRHRVFPRLRGFAAGVYLGLNQRSATRAWGARDAAAFAPVDLRNMPAEVQYQAVQWFKAGVQVTSAVRLQWSQEAALMYGEDDLTRRQVGGLNPYAVPVAGVPWGYFKAGDYGAGQGSVHWKVLGDLEVGLMGGGVVLRDADRTGSGRIDGVWGIGALIDWRSGPWQFDIRSGYAPGLAQLHPAQGAWSVFTQVGWATP